MNQLLNEISKIINIHEKINKLKGNNFNIFKTLKIESDEVKTHSRFIAELLKPDGSHGRGSLFLKLFLEELRLKSNIDLNTSKVYIESFQGTVTETTGGYIDILITDFDGNSIMIENKIYAGEQKNQLLRYHNSYPNGELLYLTLFGKQSAEDSSKKIEYKKISYNENLLNWLVICHKESVNYPNLREVLKQYIDLVKSLTNQNTNYDMDNEIIKVLMSDENKFQSFIKLKNLNIEKHLLENNIKPIIQEITEELKLEARINLFGNWPGFNFTNEKLKKNNISICFSSSSAKDFTNVVYGYTPIDGGIINESFNSNLKTKFNQNFDHYKGSGYNNWTCLGYFEFKNWSNLNELKEICFNPDNFKKVLKSKIEIMLSLI
ncbi:hypothetical protein ES692_07105 [Psychroserpens burtonensis]|uniref:PD-(D/E)XK nuclease family protein n=1 Tax=Psychroserpens burtonensis TaxID=49278 RepID=A0A5C7BA24_9FLAO|nr:PD-(D/E)XK nuclease family protein [Psychroserpens burtonensis]TXE18408.1 hypothetical protein ES692_07105 [Psychroserpens burtonensis]